MPDHVHLLLEPRVKEIDANGQPSFFGISDLLHSIKSFTAHKIAKLRGMSGEAIWEEEYHERYIRSDADLKEKFEYIVGNPWESGIVDQDEDYSWVWTPECPRRDAEDDGRDARAPQSAAAATSRPEARATQTCRPAKNAKSGATACNPATLRAPAEPPSPTARSFQSPPPLPPTEPHILVGTHALLYEGAGFTQLGLAVIDEQHKFGVMQRARLRAQGVAPDVLVMTATPIPRTLTMTLYGDLDVSTLDEMPAHRGKIVTGVREAKKLPEAVKFLREQLEAGRQAYVVYPLIDESEKLEAKAAATEFAKWQEFLAPMPCALLHGRIDPEEKDAIMEKFRRGETKALIATTVIEVGIDVPNASIMLIENAERFGLAQLHQLRGRIGRGEHKSYCILLRSAKAEAEADEKLRIMEQTSNGFEIAEADLRLRGPGDILGTAQSGLPPLQLGDLLKDQELMRLARNAAFLIFERDPRLEQPENQRYRRTLAETRKLMLSQVS
jgi:hypothetical protein